MHWLGGGSRPEPEGYGQGHVRRTGHRSRDHGRRHQYRNHHGPQRRLRPQRERGAQRSPCRVIDRLPDPNRVCRRPHSDRHHPRRGRRTARRRRRDRLWHPEKERRDRFHRQGLLRRPGQGSAGPRRCSPQGPRRGRQRHRQFRTARRILPHPRARYGYHQQFRPSLHSRRNAHRRRHRLPQSFRY